VGIKLPVACEQDMRGVPLPSVNPYDLGAHWAENASALETANSRLANGRECVARMRGLLGTK